VKELEHRKVKRLAGEILGQRGDVEAFFLQVWRSASSAGIQRVAPVSPAHRRRWMKCGSALRQNARS
jgi:hypothetical protein